MVNNKNENLDFWLIYSNTINKYIDIVKDFEQKKLSPDCAIKLVSMLLKPLDYALKHKKFSLEEAKETNNSMKVVKEFHETVKKQTETWASYYTHTFTK